MTARWREAAFFVLSACAIVPLWIIERPPSQDWSQHVAAVRVLIDYADPALRLADAVTIDISRTQYLGFYLAAMAFAQVLGAAAAVKALMSCALIAIPYSVRSLLRAVGSDERYALFCLSITYTAHVILGFVSFVAAVPVAVFAISAAARLRETPTFARTAQLAGLLIALFYLHVLPFCFALIGVVALLGIAPVQARLKGALAVLPAGALAFTWSRQSQAGAATSNLVLDTLLHRSSPDTRFDPISKTVHELPEWLTDVVPGNLDTSLLAVTCLAVSALGIFFREPRPLEKGHKQLARIVAGVLPVLALLFAFILPYQHGWIWPVAGRFPYLFLIFLPLLLPRMKDKAGDIVAVVIAALGLTHLTIVGAAFVNVQKYETRGFEGAVAAVPTGARVLGLMYNSSSNYVVHNVFMHFHAYAQGENGGVMNFSFANLPQSPFVYNSAPAGPPALNLGVGWAPQNADMATAATYYEYLVARGQHPHLSSAELFYEPIYSNNGWTVHRRRRSWRGTP